MNTVTVLNRMRLNLEVSVKAYDYRARQGFSNAFELRKRNTRQEEIDALKEAVEAIRERQNLEADVLAQFMALGKEQPA